MQAAAKPTLLFVDDEEAIVKTLRAVFRFDYNVITTTNPLEALEILKSQQVHVIVSDQRMPEMTGIEVLAKAREIAPNAIRILLTGFSDLAAIVGSVNEGQVFRFINKPWGHKEIKEIIAQAVAIAMQTAAMPITTSVVSEELASNPIAEAHKHLLVIDTDPTVAEAVKRLFDGHTVHAVSSLQKALQVLEGADVSVIVSELDVNGEDIRPFLRILKHRHPLIQSILVTRMVDSDDIIKLINQAQIFRFTGKPVTHGALRLAVNAALRQYAMYQKNPHLLVRHQVEEIKPEEVKPSLVLGIMKSLRAFGSRFAMSGN